MTKRKESTLWLALLVLAAALRLLPIASGLPYIDYVDEGHILHPAIGILKAERFDSSVYTYPPLTSYLVVGAIKAYSPIYRIVHQRPVRDDLPADQELKTSLGDRYDLITPPEVIWLGRLVVACLSIGTVLFAGALAKLIGGSRAGLLAMLFAALCPALVSRGSNLALDPTGTFFVLATLYFCERLRIAAGVINNAAMWRNAALAGIASGLAFAGKFTAGAAFVAVIVTIVTLPIAWRAKLLVLLAAGAGLFVGAFCGVPAVVLHPEKVIGELRYITSFYQTIRSEHGYWQAAFSAAEVGGPLMIAGLAGIIWMLWNQPTRKVGLSWTAFAFVLFLGFASSSFKPFRNFLPLVPLFCVAGALLCGRLAEYVKSRVQHPFRASVFAIALVLVIAFSLARPAIRHAKWRMQRVDTRVQAIDWLQQRATKDQRVLGLHETAILPTEWNRLAATTTVVSWFDAADLLERERFDYIVTGEFDLRHSLDPNAWSAYLDRWKSKASALPVEASFGSVLTPVVPYLWRTNEQHILILKGTAQ